MFGMGGSTEVCANTAIRRLFPSVLCVCLRLQGPLLSAVFVFCGRTCCLVFLVVLGYLLCSASGKHAGVDPTPKYDRG